MDLLDWKTIGSMLATFMFLRTAIRDVLPPEVYRFLRHIFSNIFFSISPTVSILIEEYHSSSLYNELYSDIQCYLSSKCFSSAPILKMSKASNSKQFTFTMETNQNIEDVFNGFKLKWSFHALEKKATGYNDRGQETCYFKLSFNKKHKEEVHSSYIPHVMKEAALIRFKNREKKLYTNWSGEGRGRLWSPMPFSHPSTFDTIAVNPILKKEIKDDLLKFANRGEFYNRVGRAWKRGYLLYGPPGTGKTSLIAAIANFLEFDIYDLELTEVASNSQLRKLLVSTSSKSVIVIEDVDCSLDLSDRKKEGGNQAAEENEGKVEKKTEKEGFSRMISLSGVLNFVDGLWSSCGGERLIIFTTNHKERLDAALLRPGRMDKHINLSYCEFMAFKTLVKNYLAIEEHQVMNEVEELLPLVKMTPADIAEIFMSCNDNADLGMRNVVTEMKRMALTVRLRKIRECSEETVGEEKRLGSPLLPKLSV